MEEIDAEAQSDDISSSGSILLKHFPDRGVSNRFTAEVESLSRADGIALIVKQEINKFRHLSQATVVSAEVRRYLQDIVVFLRLERGVAGGVSPYATSQFELLAKYVKIFSHWRC